MTRVSAMVALVLLPVQLALFALISVHVSLHAIIFGEVPDYAKKAKQAATFEKNI